MSVDFPAPFSPSRACTSPRRTSRSMRSFAVSAPKRLVTPFSSRASGVLCSVVRVATLLDLGGDVRDLARLDLLLDLVDLGDVLLALGVDLAVADAARLHVEDGVRAGLERAVLDLLDRREHGLVDLLEGRGHDVVAQEALVGVHADALHALLLGRVQRAEAAAARDLEDDLRAVRDLVERELLALRLVDEVLRVPVEGLDLRVRVLSTGLVARDVAVDGRDLLAADRA